MEEKLLPIGSVILLRGGTKELMIIGYFPVDKETGECYEYEGCLYPEGLITTEDIALIHHDAIEKVVQRGYASAATENILKKYTQLYKRLKENKNITKAEIESLMQ